ncbi:MAG TPA: PAS domain S-box protein, partial [Cytophaga sp.]|nr:PAS domain S-box protein [Cytophaga sp.]
MIKVPQLNLNADTGNNARHNVKRDIRFRKLIENSYEGISLLDKELNITYQNRSAEQIGGWDAANRKTNGLIELIHPDDRDTVKLIIKEILLRPDQPKTCNFRTKHFEGHYIYVQCVFTNYLNDPDIAAIVLNWRDVSNDALNGIAQERTRIDLEKIVISSLDIICSVDVNGYVLQISASSQSILGYAPEELIGKQLFDFIYPEDKKKTEKIVALIIEGNNVTDFENRYIKKDGSLVYLSWTSKWNGRDKIRYGAARDITERKKWEAALIDSEQKYKTLFENNPLPLFLFDFDTLQILDCNKELERKYGYTKEEFTKLTLRDIRPPEDIALMEDAVKSKEIHGKSHHRVWRHKKKNGEIMFMEVTGHLIEFNGRTVSLAMVNDITESYYFHELDKIEKNVLEMSTRNDKDLSELIEVYLLGVEALHPGIFCSFFEKRGKKLYNIASPRLPEEYIRVIEGVEISETSGICGRAAFLKQKVIVNDIKKEDFSAGYKNIINLHQLKACWSHPIIDANEDVIAIFACYYKEIKTPSELEQKTIERAANILKIIFESYLQKQALSFSNQRFEYATEATSDVIWDWDLDNNVVYYSGNLSKLFGHKKQAGVNYDNLPFFTEHVHPGDRERVVLKPDQVKFGSMINWAEEYRFKKANGEYAFVMEKALVIRDDKGLGRRMVGAIQDITKQKLEERHLKLLESVVTNTTDSILITEAEPLDFHGPQILYANEAFTKMTGYTAAEVIGKTPRMLQGPKTDKRELSRLKES